MAADKCRVVNDKQWPHCNVCDGRIHQEDCTTRKRKGIDCFEHHTPEELEAAGYGPADEHRRYQQGIT